MNSTIFKVLAVDTGTHPIKTERFDVSMANPALAKQTILTVMNRMGKNAHCLVKQGNKMFVCDHTAKRGPSDDYHKHAVDYHPFMGELA